ncbi:MAG: hypothetical protein IJZ26_03340 [Clostridia bacterium]|nr:hypothetical protein [Clostridia bacterium]
MEKEVISKIGELVENCGHISKLLITNEIAMAEGNIQVAQKCTIESQELLRVIINDVFVEVKEVFNIDVDEVELVAPSIMEMVKVLSDIEYNAGVLINLLVDEQSELICANVKTKIVKGINTVTKIANELFFN